MVFVYNLLKLILGKPKNPDIETLEDPELVVRGIKKLSSLDRLPKPLFSCEIGLENPSYLESVKAKILVPSTLLRVRSLPL